MNFYAKKFAKNLRRNFRGLTFVTRITIVSHFESRRGVSQFSPRLFKR